MVSMATRTTPERAMTAGRLCLHACRSFGPSTAACWTEATVSIYGPGRRRPCRPRTRAPDAGRSATGSSAWLPAAWPPRRSARRRALRLRRATLSAPSRCNRAAGRAARRTRTRLYGRRFDRSSRTSMRRWRTWNCARSGRASNIALGLGALVRAPLDRLQCIRVWTTSARHQASSKKSFQKNRGLISGAGARWT
jgi:hypothetical protein